RTINEPPSRSPIQRLSFFIMVFVIKNPECCSQKSSNDCNRHAGDMPWLGSEQMGDLLMMIIE
ncbi:hypothetical protein MJI67_24115, partial [Salmonella enterica subsp. enterica serovar Cerro]|nr:hypothetical protein [Salmonella enterica subsp. enterica serovar Cerro]